MKVAIYVRVSTLEQAEFGYSIDEQVDRLTKCCDVHDWNVHKIYKDGGFSGSTLDRPAIKQLISDAKRQKFEAVLVYKLDRLSRSQKDVLYIIEDVFIKNEIAFISLSENLDTSSAFGKAAIGFSAVIAQLEREQIKERMTMGKIGRAKSGKPMSWSIVPFGYMYKDGSYVPDPLRAPIVKRIFSDYLKGSSITKIHDILNDEGHIGKDVKWSHRTVRTVLDNPVYAGYNRYLNEDYPGNHEAIITKEMYDKTQKEIVIRQKEAYEKNNNPRPFQAKYILSGLMRCGICGAILGVEMNPVRKDGTRYRYYRCASRNSRKHNRTVVKNPNGCSSDNYSLEELEKNVLLTIDNFKLNPENINKLSKNEKNFDTSAYLNEINRLDKSLEKLVDLYLEDAFPKKQLEKRRLEIEEKKSALERKLDSLEAEKPILDPNAAINKLREIEGSIFDLSYEKQKDIVKYLVDKIIVYPKRLDIFWKFVKN